MLWVSVPIVFSIGMSQWLRQHTKYSIECEWKEVLELGKSRNTESCPLRIESISRRDMPQEKPSSFARICAALTIPLVVLSTCREIPSLSAQLSFSVPLRAYLFVPLYPHSCPSLFSLTYLHIYVSPSPASFLSLTLFLTVILYQVGNLWEGSHWLPATLTLPRGGSIPLSGS